MSQVVEQEKPASPQVAHYAAEYRRSIAQAPAQPRWVATGPRERDRAVRAPRLSDHEARAVALHERRADRRAHVCARDGWRRRRRADCRLQAAQRARSRTPCASTAGSRRSCRGSTRCRKACSCSVSKRHSRRTRRSSNRISAKLSLTADQRVHVAEYGVPARRHRADASRAHRDRAAD